MTTAQILLVVAAAGVAVTAATHTLAAILDARRNRKGGPIR